MSESLGVAVLASGSGTNLQALIDKLHLVPERGVRIQCVVGSKAGIGAVDRAAEHRIPSHVMPAGADETWLLDTLESSNAGLVVLAGWLKLIPPGAVRAWRGRMINIHPALLPSFGGPGMYGRRVHDAVINAGARISGPTVHFVDEIYDNGAIIAQWPVPVLESDDGEALAGRVLKVEHRLLPAVVASFARNSFELGGDGRVTWKEPWFEHEVFDLIPNASQ
ncbi:MAG: phosphoribosylglycinamide formyltransferase [marine benthic group bacterium]|nr:phosphoribosylglycinamide formyltransferase [Candidatus Benthicola marisminoris]